MTKQAAIDLGKQGVLAPTHLGLKTSLKQALGKLVAAPTAESKPGFWVKGSGPVYIPVSRANEVPKVLEERRKQEYNRVILSTYLRRAL